MENNILMIDKNGSILDKPRSPSEGYTWQSYRANGNKTLLIIEVSVNRTCRLNENVCAKTLKNVI